MTARQAALLVLPTFRTTGWPALVGAAAVAAGLLTLPGSDALLLLLAAGLLAGAVAFLVEDAAEATVASVPPSLLARRLLRIAVALPLLAALWALLAWYGGADASVPTLALAALAALAAALAASRGAVAGAAAPVVVLVAAFALPDRLELLDGSDAATARWFVLLGVAIAAFCAASRDLGHRWRRRGRDSSLAPSPPNSPRRKENDRCSLTER